MRVDMANHIELATTLFFVWKNSDPPPALLAGLGSVRVTQIATQSLSAIPPTPITSPAESKTDEGQLQCDRPQSPNTNLKPDTIYN